jgi:glycosyltransferase involved in cell wall biosynthesis
MARTSVVVPCYNEQEFLNQSVLSALQQSCPPKEIVVVDDGSTVPITIGSDHARRGVRLIRTPNRGCGPARNAALPLCSGEYVAFLDADDHWAPTKLERQEALLDRRRDAVLCFTRCISAPGYFGFGPYPPESATTAEQLFVLWFAQFFPPSSVMVRRGALVEVGGFDESVGRAQDRELWFRLAARGEFAQVPEPLTYYRVHERQLTASPAARILGNALSRRRVAVRSADMLRRIGIEPGDVDLAERHEIMIAFYRRQFRHIRKLLWSYCLRHPRDLKMLVYALVSLVPPAVVRALRGGVGAGEAASVGDETTREWADVLSEMRGIHA